MDIFKTSILILFGMISMAGQSGEPGDLANASGYQSSQSEQVEHQSQTARVQAIRQVDQWRIQTRAKIAANADRISQVADRVSQLETRRVSEAALETRRVSEPAPTPPMAADLAPSIDAELLTFLMDANSRLAAVEAPANAAPFNGPFEVVETITYTEPVTYVSKPRPAVRTVRQPLLNPGRPGLFGRRRAQATQTSARCVQNFDGSWSCSN